MEFFSVKKGLEFWRGLTNQSFLHKASFRRFFLTHHSPYPKRPPRKNQFFKKKPNEILGLLIFSMGTKRQQSKPDIAWETKLFG